MSFTQQMNGAKPYLSVIFVQISYSIMSVITKFALNQGVSQHVLVAYRMVFATILITPFAIVFDRNKRPKMTFPILAKIVLLSLFQPVVSQNLYYTGMKYTTATFTVTMLNIVPALTFIMACIFRLEKVKIKRLHSQGRIMGTIATVGGAIIMTLVKGPILKFPWKEIKILHNQTKNSALDHQDHRKGALMITAGCFAGSCFIILQAFILKSYPAELSLTALVCMISSVEGTILALAIERGNAAVWSLHWDAKLLAVLYGGFVSCSTYFTMGWLIKKRGPVFVTCFNPLGMVISAILGYIFLDEKLYTGSIIGAVIIVIGLYMILCGRSEEPPGPPPSVSHINQLPRPHHPMPNQY